LYQQDSGQPAESGRQKRSHDLGRSFPAEGLLRAFTFETCRPIKYGSSIGQSLQTLRLLDAADERILDAALGEVGKGATAPLAGAAGLWTKCDSVFADYFLKNWSRRREPLAFRNWFLGLAETTENDPGALPGAFRRQEGDARCSGPPLKPRS
jgi:hypothetical protein